MRQVGHFNVEGLPQFKQLTILDAGSIGNEKFVENVFVSTSPLQQGNQSHSYHQRIQESEKPVVPTEFKGWIRSNGIHVAYFVGTWASF